MTTPTPTQRTARDEAIERGLLWALRDLWLENPLPRPELRHRLGERMLTVAINRRFVRAVPTRAGALYTPAGRGRQALRLDRAHLSPPHALELAFARRCAAEALLEGYRVAAPPRPALSGAKHPERDDPWAEPDYRELRGAARAYGHRELGRLTWLLVGTPDPSPATAARLVDERAGGHQVILVANDARPYRRLQGAQARAWKQVLPLVGPGLRSPLQRLLKASQ